MQKTKTNQFICFFGESTARQSAYGFIEPLVSLLLTQLANKGNSKDHFENNFAVPQKRFC